MFAYPPATAFHRVVPKTKIYAHAQVSKRLKTLFAAQVSELTWTHKLSPETLKLPARDGIQEIQVFALTLKTPELAPELLQLIDQAIPFPILFELNHDGTTRFAAAYKRHNAAAAGKWVIEARFQTAPLPASTPRLPLPVALDLASLHDQLVRHHIALPARPGEPLADHVARWLALAAKQKSLRQLETRLAREKQFNRKVELNAAVRSLSHELETLTRI